MPTYEIKIVRTSTLIVDCATKEGAEEFVIEMARAKPGHPLFPILEQTSEPAYEYKDIKTTKDARWSVMGGKVTFKPHVVPNKDALTFLTGDFQNDSAVIRDRATSAVKAAYIWIKGVVIEPKKNLAGAFMPHLVFEGSVICEFDPKSMVPHGGNQGVWVQQEVMQHIVAMMQQQGPQKAR